MIPHPRYSTNLENISQFILLSQYYKCSLDQISLFFSPHHKELSGETVFPIMS